MGATPAQAAEKTPKYAVYMLSSLLAWNVNAAKAKARDGADA